MASIRIFLQGALKADEALDAGGLVIGRGDDVGLRLDEKKLSKLHARIIPNGRQWLLEDLGSRNGSFVNGRREVRRPLVDGDSIELGAYVLVFKQGAGEVVPPLPPDVVENTAAPVTAKRPGAGDVYQRRSPSTEEAGLKTMAKLRSDARALVGPRLTRVGGGEPRFFPLVKERSTIGGDPDCEVPVKVSQEAVAQVVRLDDGTYELQKIGWISRVKVNGRGVSRHVLDLDDVVRVGDEEFTFEIPAA